MFGQLHYLILESFRGLKQHRTVVLPSLITIFLCSLLLASSLTAFGAMLKVLRVEKSLYTVEAFLAENVEGEALKTLQNQLVHMRHIGSVEFVSADSALADFRRHFNEEMLDLVEGNPLPPFFRLKLDEESQNPMDLIAVRNELQKKEIFEEVQAPVEWVERISKWKFKMIFWPLCLSALLLVALSLIISNSVRLSLFSRKLLVENMKYAGGSSFFIEFPFVLEGLMLGALGSCLSVALLATIVRSIGESIPLVGDNLNGFGLLLAAVVLLVTLLSTYFSYRTVRSFLLAKGHEQE